MPVLTLILLIAPLCANAISRGMQVDFHSSQVSASDWQAPHGPENTRDGDLNTRWSAKGDGQTIEYNLGSYYDVVRPTIVDSVAIAWFKGDRRQARFSIEVSLDGQEWLEVYHGQSSGTTIELERYAFPLTLARHVRMIGHGNTSNTWNSLTEVQIYEASVSLPRILPALSIFAINASDWQHPHVPDNTQDRDFRTRWSAKGDGQTIEYDLGFLHERVNGVAIAWFKGDRRQARFTIEASLDGQEWREVYHGESSGTTHGLELYSFLMTSSQYIRIVGHGNTANSWNSLTEVRIYRALH